ncbi:MAG: TonB-dependent receptor, partial [Cellvibrionaceae bacterium]|nr:TonB-dependent receptor [Cellvibrionaceae bacterium]
SIKNSEQIEILRGPQSMLYGANADAGVIVIRSRQADTTSADIYTAIETFAGRQSYLAGAYLAGPLSEQLSASVSLDIEKGDSYIRNITSSINEPGEIEDINLNAKLRYTGEASELNLHLLYNELSAPGLYEQEFPALNYQDYNHLYAPSYNANVEVGKYDIANDAPKNTDETEWGLGLAYQYDLDEHGVDMVFAYRRIDDSSVGTDLDLTAAPFTAGGGRGDREFWSVETRLSSQRDDSQLNYMLGLAYYRESLTRQLSTLLGPGGLDQYQYAPEQFTENQDLSAFVHLQLPLADKLKLEAGLRYDRAEADIQQQAGSLVVGPGLVFNYVALNKDVEDTILLPKLSLSYQLDDIGQVYATVSKGYLPGGYNLVAGDKGEDIDRRFGSYGAEELWSYEIGTKLNLLNQRLFLAAAVFYIDASSWQEINILTAPDGSVLSTTLINSDASVESKGVELELDYQVNEQLNLRLGLGYVDSSYQTYDFGPSISYAGNDTKMIPKYDISLSGQYQFNDNWSARIEMHGLGKAALSNDNSVYRQAMQLWDASLSFKQGGLGARLYVENATNKRYAAGLAYQNFLFGNDGVVYAPIAQPRTLGLELSWSF